MRGACIVGDQRERKCVFVCLCGWVHMCMCINICHIKMEVCVYVSVCMCVYLYMSHQNGSVCVFMWVCAYVYVCMCIYVTYEWKCMRVCVCTPSSFLSLLYGCWLSRVSTDAIACQQDWASRAVVRQLAPSASCSVHDRDRNIVPCETSLLLLWQILLPSPLETESLYVQSLEIKCVDLLSYEFIIAL